jgi:hypothetical protein
MIHSHPDHRPRRFGARSFAGFVEKKSGRLAAHREVYERVIDFGVAYSIFTSSAYRERDAKWRFPQEIATQDTAQE